MLVCPSSLASYVYKASTRLTFLRPRLGATAGPTLFPAPVPLDEIEPGSDVTDALAAPDRIDSARSGIGGPRGVTSTYEAGTRPSSPFALWTLIHPLPSGSVSLLFSLVHENVPSASRTVISCPSATVISSSPLLV